MSGVKNRVVVGLEAGEHESGVRMEVGGCNIEVTVEVKSTTFFCCVYMQF